MFDQGCQWSLTRQGLRHLQLCSSMRVFRIMEIEDTSVHEFRWPPTSPIDNASSTYGAGLSRHSTASLMKKPAGVIKKPACVSKKPAGVCKKPAASSSPRMEIRTPLLGCFKCGSKLMDKQPVVSTLIGMEGSAQVHLIPQRCWNKSCRMTHLYNYRWENGAKVNTLRLDEAKYVFVTSKKGFTMQYLRYHDALQFKGGLASKAMAWAGKKHLYPELQDEYRVDMSYNAARLLMLAMKEFGDMLIKPSTRKTDKLMQVNVDQPITEALLRQYSSWWHDNVLSASDTQKVKCLAFDGEQKFAPKCKAADVAPKHGRPSDDGHISLRHNGWFMASEPATGFILGAMVIRKAECNAVFFEMAQRMLLRYKKVDCGLYDRFCRVLPEISRTPRLQRLFRGMKYKAVDVWHGYKHGDDCPCSPWNHEYLWTRLEDENTSVAEQVFSWFRSHTAALNSASALHHEFLVLYLCRVHNELMSDGDFSHLPPAAAPASRRQQNSSVPYSCS